MKDEMQRLESMDSCDLTRTQTEDNHLLNLAQKQTQEAMDINLVDKPIHEISQQLQVPP